MSAPAASATSSCSSESTSHSILLVCGACARAASIACLTPPAAELPSEGDLP